MDTKFLAGALAAVGFMILLVGAAVFDNQPTIVIGLGLTVIGVAWAAAHDQVDDVLANARMPERRAVPQQIRIQVFLRANEGCQYPECTVRAKRMLDVHHIDMNRANSMTMDNLIALCANHHRLLHGEHVPTTKVKGWATGGRSRSSARRPLRRVTNRKPK